jgi:hypothetical protein
MNSTALAAVMEVIGFTLIHLVNLSNAMEMCVNPRLAYLNGLQLICSDEPGSRHQNWLSANKTPADMSCPQACVHLRGYHKFLSGCHAE